MAVIKWSDAIKVPRVKVDGPLCGGLYKEYHGSIVPWSGTYPDSKLNYFTWSKEDNYWIFLRYRYNEEFKNWQGPIHNGQFYQKTLNNHRIIDRICPSIQDLSSLTGFL